MKTYTSGRNRVHASMSVIEINAAINEYEQFAAAHPLNNLTRELLECVADLREELEIRSKNAAIPQLKPYRFSFTADGIRHTWIRFYRDMETALEDSKRVAIKENPTAKCSAFFIESDQNDEAIRKSWGLDF